MPDTVYLLEYLPAEAPTHYRVRVLHTSTGEVGLPVNLRDKSTPVDAEMAGISRTQVVSGHDDGLLFTLYRGVAGEGDRHGYAFVHTLGFAGGVWCLDIAPEMELDRLPGALVVAGDRLVVASANGTIGSYDIARGARPDAPAGDGCRHPVPPSRGRPGAGGDRRSRVGGMGQLRLRAGPGDPRDGGVRRRNSSPEPVTRDGGDRRRAGDRAIPTARSCRAAATSIDVTPGNDDDAADIVALFVDDAGASP